ncbi:hypothetical protein SDC9_181291 [bioreactor metagenome]|uniref:Uncharacterized protein n=1 Tax=bioreactor metagenome TaxID=1076179 RepID=A0A645H6U2_9ZZZZ
MKSGFWGNYRTGEYFEIDDHELWIRRGDNTSRLGISSDIEARFCEFTPRLDRDRFLPFLYASAPVMCWRAHGQYVTFEFNAVKWDLPLDMIRTWCRSNAGDFLGLKIVNFGTREFVRCLWKDFETMKNCRYPWEEAEKQVDLK